MTKERYFDPGPCIPSEIDDFGGAHSAQGYLGCAVGGGNSLIRQSGHKPSLTIEMPPPLRGIRSSPPEFREFRRDYDAA